MAGLKHSIIRGGLEGLYFTGAHLVLKPLVGGVGAILTFHHVLPPRVERFQPNRILEITPRFLTRVVKLLRRSNVDVISLDEMQRRTAVDPAHAFYLGYEMAKAVTSLTLGKNYVQDEALRWGFLTRPEQSHRQQKTSE